MNKADKQHTFDRFGIKVPNGRVNLIAVDLGDGEYCAYQSIYDDADGKAEILRILNDDKDHRDMSLYLEIKGERYKGKLAHDISLDAANRHLPLYESFKKPPKSIQAQQNYGHRTDTLPHIEIMKRFFYCVIRDIFRYNKQKLEKNKDTFIFVGRPASAAWKDCELEYARALENEIDGGKFGNVNVVVYSEAEAALASMEGIENRADDKVTVIIDGGSSTYDAVLIKGKEIIDQISWQLGAAKIEHNLYDLFAAKEFGEEESVKDEKGIKKRAEIRNRAADKLIGEDRNESKSIIKLRTNKESYFGREGNADNAQLFKFSGSKNNHIIDAQSMRAATHEMAIEVISNGDMTDTVFPSFASAVECFFKVVKQIIDSCGSGVERSVILTGGSTVMPFVAESARDIFGKTVVARDAEPNYSVVKGLAYMSRLELLTYREKEKLIGKIERAVFDERDHICSIITQACVDDIWNRNFKTALEKWKDSGEDLSLNDWWKKCDFGVRSNALKSSLHSSLTDLESKINALIKQSFESLLGSVKTFKIHEGINVGAALSKACENMKDISVPRPELHKFIGDIESFGAHVLALFTQGKFIDGELALKKVSRDNFYKYIKKDRITEYLRKSIISSCGKASEEFTEQLKARLTDQIPKHVESMKKYLL